MYSWCDYLVDGYRAAKVEPQINFYKYNWLKPVGFLKPDRFTKFFTFG